MCGLKERGNCFIPQAQGRFNVWRTIRYNGSGLEDLLHGEETVIWGDQAYWKEADRQTFEEAGVRYRVNRRAPGGNKNQSEYWKRINRTRSRTRARGEHPFRVVKQLWGFTKTRYRGIAKNLARAQTMFALANLYAVRHRLRPLQASAAL
ncbi:MAG: transposase [bacterium]